MRQQEGFRTPDGARDGAPGALPAPAFDERSAQKAAPVVPLEKVARRERFTRLGGGLRETVSTPQFRRSWPLALLAIATLAAAVAATNIYTHDDAQRVAPATVATTAETADDTTATGDARETAAPAARNETDGPRATRDARRESADAVEPDDKAVVNPEAFTASALGGFLGGANDGEQRDAAAHDEQRGERDKGKRHKRSKRRQGARRGNGGGAILFDVIR